MKAGSKRLDRYAKQLGYEFIGTDGAGHLTYRHDHTRNEVRITSGCHEGPAFIAYRAALERGAGFQISKGGQTPQERRKGPKKRRGTLADQHAAAKAQRQRQAILDRKLAEEAKQQTPTPSPSVLDPHQRVRQQAEEQRRTLTRYAVAARYDELRELEALMR